MQECTINDEKMQSIYKRIGLNVKRIRQSKNVSQLALALAIGHKAVGTVSMAELCINNKHLLDTINKKIHSINGIFETNTTMYLDVRKWASQDVSTDFSHLEDKNTEKEITKKNE